jgi:hypothetical protein
MKFTLTYDGPLAANGRPSQKHNIRLALHPQLRELRKHKPFAQFYEFGGPNISTVGGHNFAATPTPALRATRRYGSRLHDRSMFSWVADDDMQQDIRALLATTVHNMANSDGGWLLIRKIISDLAQANPLEQLMMIQLASDAHARIGGILALASGPGTSISCCPRPSPSAGTWRWPRWG